MQFTWLQKAENVRLFGETEAWWLFKTAALAEAVGWTVLLTGIAYRHYRFPAYRYAIPIAGQFHGTIFLAYFGVVIVLYPSLQWSRKKAVLALVAGVPPYGTLVYEQWAAMARQRQRRQTYVRCVCYTLLAAQAV
jgi:integral membrane protein